MSRSDKAAFTANRVLLDQEPALAQRQETPWSPQGEWPYAWVMHPAVEKPPFVLAFRCAFVVKEPTKMRWHVTADERYELFLDGQRIGRGSERGDAQAWFFETYEVICAPGAHVVVARVWAAAPFAPWAQISLGHGFLLATDEEVHGALVGTGVAAWEAAVVPGYSWSSSGTGGGGNLQIDGSAVPWGIEHGAGGAWVGVVAGERGVSRAYADSVARPRHLLVPAGLPAMVEKPFAARMVRFVGSTMDGPVRTAAHLAGEAGAWQAFIAGEAPIAIPAQTRRRVILDLGDYYCAYHALHTSGGKGGRVQVHFAETLMPPGPATEQRGNRDEIDGGVFRPVGNAYLPGGGVEERHETLWWHAGRYVQVLVEAGESPLVLRRLELRETRYPLAMESRITFSDARVHDLLPLLTRSVQMCAHETYMDCPFYEQMMYVGDTRTEVLATYVMSRDARLPRKALLAFDGSRGTDGLTACSYPSHSVKRIPPFSLWWVNMSHDYFMWRDDPATVRSLLPGIRATLDAFLTRYDDAGLIRSPYGWNYVDACGWRNGIPPEANSGASAPINLQVVLALDAAAEMEDALGEAEMAARYRRHASGLAGRVVERFWDERRGLLADALGERVFSEHAQALALITGRLPAGHRKRLAMTLPGDPELARTGPYFSHYLFEGYRLIERADLIVRRLELWYQMQQLGMKTTPEHLPGETRSDCHGWGAHPLFHFFATVLGIRPAAPGFAAVRIAPQLGGLAWAKGVLVHARGGIEVAVRQQDGGLHGAVTLPEGLCGELVTADRTLWLTGGRTEF